MLMDSSFFLTIFVAEIGFLVLFGTIGFFELLSALFFVVLRIFRFLHPENKDLASSSSPPSSPLSSSSPPSSLPSYSSPPSSLSSSTPSSSKWTHDVFPSFRGEDVRKNFLSHIQKEFQRKGITPFIDNDIKRGESIGPELIQAIRRSKIAVILISRNYASSKWCLDELAEIMNCKKELGQTVFAVFYEVDPSHVKKLAGEFGAVFKKTCAGKSKEDIQRWRQAFAEVATIAGYDSRNWNNEAVMIEEIVAEISKTLISSTPSRYMEDLIGVQAHIEKMKSLLCLGSGEVRTVGIWGPCGIGKTAIARVLRDQVSDAFQLSVFMRFEPSYTRSPSSDDHDERLHLEQQFLSQLINKGDVKIPHLGAAQDFVMGKKLLVILDGVEKLVQLLAMPQARYFGHGSRIIITTQNLRLLNAFEVNHIYQVDFPPPEEALQIFCISAFGQTSPKAGYENLAWEVTNRAGSLPLGLKIMGSLLRGMSKEEWEKELPRLRIHLDGELGSILKLSYDSLHDEDKNLFLHMACFFVEDDLFDDYTIEDALGENFSNVGQGFNVLVKRSLLTGDTLQPMHNLLVQLGREIVRNQSIHEPGERQFLVDTKEISEVFTKNTGSKTILGIKWNMYEMEEDLCISERVFENMSNLQFLRFYCDTFVCGFSQQRKLKLPQGLKYLPPKLRILHWDYYPLKCLPSDFTPEFLVKISMQNSQLEKLWEGILPLGNLKFLDFSFSKNLKELPDLSTATNLTKIYLMSCTSLVELPSSIGHLINLDMVNLKGCSSLVKIPSSIGNLQMLEGLFLKGCSKLEVLPFNINLSSLETLEVSGCSQLRSFPHILTNIRGLDITGTLIKEVPLSINSWSKLEYFSVTYCKELEEFPYVLDIITNLELDNTEIEEIPPWVSGISRLKGLVLNKCRKLKLISLPQVPDSLEFLIVKNCDSLERLACSFLNLKIDLTFIDCWKLNEETRDIIIQSPSYNHVVLPGREVPAFFTYQSTRGSSLTVKLNQRCFPTSLRFKVCFSLVAKDEKGFGGDDDMEVYSSIVDKQSGCDYVQDSDRHYLGPLLTEHLYTFEVAAEDVKSGELLFEFGYCSHEWEIAKCGVCEIYEEDCHVDDVW